MAQGPGERGVPFNPRGDDSSHQSAPGRSMQPYPWWTSRAPSSWMAHDLKGDLSEEVADDTLFSRSPTTGPRYGPARRGFLAPDRSSLPGERLLRHEAVETLSQHQLSRARAPRRGPSPLARAGGLGAAPGVDPPAARRHARGVPTAARHLVQHHDDLARPAQAGVAAQEEDPARRGAGPPQGPGA